MTREQMIDTAVRRAVVHFGGDSEARLCWMATYGLICGDNSPYVHRVRKEFARLVNG